MKLSFLREDEISQFESSDFEDEISKFENNEIQSSKPMEPIFQTFNIKCKKRLSRHAKSILLAWNSKPFYCANEDILYLFKSNLIEQDFLLKTLHSMAIFLQNVTCTSFFDISIYSVAITPEKTDQNYNNSDFVESITFKLKCHVARPPEKTEVPW